MNVEFASSELRRAWEDSSWAFRRWGATVGRKYIQRIGQIQEVSSQQTLMELRSLRVHALRGPLAGRYAMTLHDRWRLVFSFRDAATVTIEDVSNHYDD